MQVKKYTLKNDAINFDVCNKIKNTICDIEENKFKNDYAIDKNDVRGDLKLELNGKVGVDNASENKIYILNSALEQSQIVYDKMGGRPSIKLKLNGKLSQCLLDTGARINVIDITAVKEIGNVEIKLIKNGIFCANGSPLKTIGLVELIVIIDGIEKKIEFVVVENLSPKIIGGVNLLNNFNIRLVKKYKEEIKVYDDFENVMCQEICSIAAKFGEIITDEMRFKKIRDILNLDKSDKLFDILFKNKEVFMANKWDIGKTNLVKHEIITSGQPILLNPRRQPAHLEEKIEEALKNLEDNKIIRKCESAWNTPMVCVWKKEKKDIRLCLDFRSLNKITERKAFPMPNIEEMLDSLKGSKFFSTIDLGSAYYQIELEPESQEKTAFSTRKGQFCFNRMPFGIAAAPATFQKLMTMVLGDLLWKVAVVYLDDILIFADTKEEHLKRIEMVLERIKYAGLKVNPEKCLFLKIETKFLGHIINGNGIRTDDNKIESIRGFERPKCIKKLRSFLGLCNYYRKFIKSYAKIARNLEAMCGNNNKDKLVWTEECENGFNELKNALIKTPILVYPDYKKEFILDTDASFDTIGAVLSQQDEHGNERVIAYGSHSMSKHEIGYCITRKELLAIYYFTQHFKHYLYGKRFVLRTDHKALTFMLTTKKPITAQFQTWINFLSSLDMDIKYRKGSEHSNADALSRDKCGHCTQCMGSHIDAKTEKIKTRLLALSTNSPDKQWQEDNDEIEYYKKIINKQNEYDECKFKLIDGIVKTAENKTWIPRKERSKFINEMHKKLCHAGSFKMIEYIKLNYDMENFQKIATEIIKSCELCQKRKIMTIKTKEIDKKKTISEPFEVIEIDFCGPLKANQKGKKYILGIIDQCSRYISLTAVANQDDKTTKDILLKNWILKFGAPRIIQLDCGKAFESKLIKEMADKHNIVLQHSSPYHHNANGLIERQFRTIRDFISLATLDKYKKDWVDALPEVEFVLNATIQKTTGRSPAEIIFGFRLFKEWKGKRVTSNREEIIKGIQHKQGNKEKTNEEETKREFKINDEVLVKTEVRTKEQDRYIGPYTVVQKRHDRSYILRDKNDKELVRNVEWLKSFKRGGCEE